MKRRPQPEVPVVPTTNLVDIAILMVIFYMACSNFISQQPGALKLPRSEDIAKLGEPQVLITIDKAGEIRLQGKTVNATEIEGAVTTLITGKTEDDQRRVMFKCDAEASREVYGPVLEAIIKAGGIVAAIGDKGRPD